MEFSIVEGKRLNSSIYLSDGYRFIKNRESNDSIYLRCILESNVIGLAKITSNKSVLEITKTHNHPQFEYKSDSVVLANRIKRAAQSSTDGLREIFNNECRNTSGAA